MTQPMNGFTAYDGWEDDLRDLVKWLERIGIYGQYKDEIAMRDRLLSAVEPHVHDFAGGVMPRIVPLNPDKPTLAELVDVLTEVYTPRGVLIWLQSNHLSGPGFERCSAVWLVEQGMGKKAYDCALELADGNFG